MSDDFYIKNKATGKVYVGSGEVPEGYERIGAPGEPAKAPADWWQRTIGEPTRQGMQLGLTPLTAVAESVKAGDFAPLPRIAQAFRQAPQPGGLATALNPWNTPEQAAIMTGGALGGGIAGAAGAGGLGQAGSRILGSTAGGALTGGSEGATRGLIASSIAEAVPAALRFGLRHLPGASVAMQEGAAQRVRQLPDLVKPESPSAPLYANVRQMNPPISVDNTLRAIDKIGTENQALVPGLRREQVDTISSGLREMVGAGGGQTMPFQTFWNNMKSLRETVDTMGRQGGIGQGQLIALRKAMMADMEQAATQMATNPQTAEAARQLAAANAIFKKELASDSLRDFIEQRVIATRPSDGLTSVRPGQLIDYLRKDPDGVVQFLDKGERRAILETAQKMAKLRVLPPAGGAQYGSGRVWANMALGGAAGLGIGQMAGQPGMGAAIGGAVAANAPRLISSALMSEAGRKALMATLDTSTFLDFPRLATLAIALRSPWLTDKKD